MKFNWREKYAKMMRGFERLERIYTDTGSSISTDDAREATENFFSHAYHLKDYLKRAFPEKAQRVEDCVTASRALSLVADLRNSFKHGHDVKTRCTDHEKETGVPASGGLVRINTHTKIDLTPTMSQCSQRLEITFENGTFDALDLATETVKAWDDFLAVEGISSASSGSS